MRYGLTLKTRSLYLLAASIVLLSGCMHVRLLTYPSSFTWIGEEDVKSSMQAMALSMKKIDIMSRTTPLSISNQQAILNELTELEFQAAALSIQTPKPFEGNSTIPATNHLLIDEHMDEFLESVYRAKVQMQSNPANYYEVGKLAGSCLGCHRLR